MTHTIRTIAGSLLVLLFSLGSAQALTPVASPDTGVTQYVCPMHATITSDKPGDCSECGMALTAVKTVPAPAMVTEYTCPMHATVHLKTPGQCPECGMDLEAVQVAATHAPASSCICPMCIYLHSATAGSFPHCGMHLEEVKAPAASMEYSCPMHASERAMGPADCKICGMALTPAAKATTSTK